MKKSLRLSVCIDELSCAVDACTRIIPSCDVVALRAVEGTAIYEPLCAVHAAEEIENMKLSARMQRHRVAQSDACTD